MSLSRLLLLLLLVSCCRAWWFWGDDEEVVEEEGKEILVESEINTVGQNVNGEQKARDKDVDVKVEKVEEQPSQKVENVKEKTFSEEDMLKEPSLTIIKNSVKESLDDLDVIEDEDILEHFDEHGHHNLEYDQQALLGDQLEEFKHLSPEESKARLAVMVGKMDANADSFIDVQELAEWIKQTGIRAMERRTELFWNRSNPQNKPALSWDEYRARQYGFLSDVRESTAEGRWVGEEDEDQQSLAMYRQLEIRDRRRWAVADRNKNLELDKTEFLGFLHPDAVPHMQDILVIETMADLDKNGDGKLNLTEYVLNVFGDTKKVEDWDTAGLQFREYRDTNKDGAIDKKELTNWLFPTSYDQHRAEAEHLVYESDTNGDKLLSLKEAIDRYGMFVGSQATNFGEDLHLNHDEL